LSDIAAGDGTVVLNWFINITSSSFFSNWLIIGFTSFRFRAAIKAQDDKVFSDPFAWKSSRWPLAPVALLLGSTLLLTSCLYAAISPLVRKPALICLWNSIANTVTG
jgi:amino acid transporter